MCERVKRKRTKNVAAKSKKSYDFELMMISHFGCVRFVLSFTRLECVCVPLLLRNVWLSPNRMLRDTFLIHCDYFSQVSVCVCTCVFLFFLPFLFAFLQLMYQLSIISVCMGCCLIYMYVKISFILVCLPKQTVCVCVFFACFILYFFSPNIRVFVGEAGVGCRPIRCYSQRKTRV